MSALMDYKLRVLNYMIRGKSFIKAWNVWKSEVEAVVGRFPTGDSVFELGNHIGEIYLSNRQVGRTQAGVSGAGAAWERLNIWYLNLLLWDTPVVAILPTKQLLPECVRDCMTVTLYNVPTNTESDVLIFNVPEHEQLVSGKSDDLNLHLKERISDVDVVNVQCKTNWNDNAQIPNSDSLDAVETGFLPRPTYDYPDIQDILSDLIDEGFEYGGETPVYKSSPQNRWQEDFRLDPKNEIILREGDILSEQQYSNHSETVVRRFKHMLSHNGEIPEELKTKKFAQRVLPAIWDDKGPTITACSLPDDFVHYSQARSLTVREWARLQTFPDWYQFSGKRTTGGIRRAGNPRNGIYDREVPKYTQIGNAVPVKLSYEIGMHFRKLLGIQT
tara:strand:- start:415 stop:1575 length:1161 start_codon:yes stop_codon:yes gene_type:complete